MIAVAFGLQISIHRHYETTREQLRVDDWHARRALPTRVRALVLVSSLSRAAMRAIAAARVSSPTSIELVSVVADDEEENMILRQWRESGVPVPLTLLSAPYRDISSVILQYVRSRRRSTPTEMLVIYMPQFLVTHWWENLVHNQSGLRLRAALLDVPGVVITIVPWQLGEDDVVEGRQRVNDPFLRVAAPASSETTVRTHQPGDARAENTSAETS